jgi:NAD(P)-dependent dehydrogenase (short-subunit alcohol dehydrogenase family)
MTNYSNKVALVTGGNSGIGYATAKLLQSKGVKVVISGSNQENTKKAAQELGVTGLVADVTKLDQIDHLVSETVKLHSKIDYLFVNAGVATFYPVEGITEDHFNHVMDINFKGAVFTLNKAIPSLSNDASVIFLSTTMVQLAMENSAIYTASKAAMNAFAKVAAQELSSKGIRVNILSPGTITTPIYQKLGFPEENLNGFKNAMIERTPLKRFGEPEEIAEAALFLFSDASKYTTGSELVVDGGMSLNKVV